MRHSLVTLSALATLSFAPPAFADGDEKLGPASIAIAPGTGILVAGVGLHNTQPGVVDLTVPGGASVVQVLAYWEGQARDAAEQGDTDAILIGGNLVTGQRIGGPTEFFFGAWTSTYRADVTALGLVSPGSNFVAVGGLDFSTANNGFGLLVVVDDGTGAADLRVHDGNDCAYFNFASPLDATVRQTYDFAPAAADRTATLSHFFGSVGTRRPSVIRVFVDGLLADEVVDALGDTAGDEWDVLQHDILVPAGATSVSVQAYSEDLRTGRFAWEHPASLTWVTAALALPVARTTGGGGEGCTPGKWKTKKGRARWDGVGTNEVTTTIKTFNLFNATFGVTSAESGLADSITLLEALSDNTNGELSALNRHAVAGLVNADASVVNYRYTVAEVIQIYLDGINGVMSLGEAKTLLETENELGCEF